MQFDESVAATGICCAQRNPVHRVRGEDWKQNRSWWTWKFDYFDKFSCWKSPRPPRQMVEIKQTCDTQHDHRIKWRNLNDSCVNLFIQDSQNEKLLRSRKKGSAKHEPFSNPSILSGYPKTEFVDFFTELLIGNWYKWQIHQLTLESPMLYASVNFVVNSPLPASRIRALKLHRAVSCYPPPTHTQKGNAETSSWWTIDPELIEGVVPILLNHYALCSSQLLQRKASIPHLFRKFNQGGKWLNFMRKCFDSYLPPWLI